MADVEMNKGVQILLERMNSNPDEFIPTLRDGYPPKWRDILLSIEMRTNGIQRSVAVPKRQRSQSYMGEDAELARRAVY